MSYRYNSQEVQNTIKSLFKFRKVLLGQNVEIVTIKGGKIRGRIYDLTPKKIYVIPVSGKSLKGSDSTQYREALGTTTQAKGKEVFLGLALGTIGSMFFPQLRGGLGSMFGNGLTSMFGGGLGSGFGNPGAGSGFGLLGRMFPGFLSGGAGQGFSPFGGAGGRGFFW